MARQKIAFKEDIDKTHLELIRARAGDSDTTEDEMITILAAILVEGFEAQLAASATLVEGTEPETHRNLQV